MTDGKTGEVPGSGCSEPISANEWDRRDNLQSGKRSAPAEFRIRIIPVEFSRRTFVLFMSEITEASSGKALSPMETPGCSP